MATVEATQKTVLSALSHRRTEVPVPERARWQRRYQYLALSVDAVAGLAAAFVALVFAEPSTSVAAILAVAMLLPVVWVAAMGIAGAYQTRFLGIGADEFNRVVIGAVALIGVVGTVSWAAEVPLSRRYVAGALPLVVVLTLIGRYALRKHVHGQRKRGAFLCRTILLGDPRDVTEYACRLKRSSYHGYNVVGACLAEDLDNGEPVEGVPILGGADDVVPATIATHADTVIVMSTPMFSGDYLRRLSWALEPTGAHMVVAPALVEVAGPRMAVRPVDGLPLLHIDQPRLTGGKRLVKAIYDPILAGAALALLLPFLLVIAIAIKFDSPGPVFFRQARVGRDGAEFTIVKFRTMVADAEALKPSLIHLNESSGPLFKLRRDPRITGVGAFLRKTSLDEVPQLFNVLVGQMSLVGPRPHLPEEIERFGSDGRPRLRVKPGLTGLWQVSGRSDLTHEESVRTDLRYVENWSLAMDLLIMWKTLAVVIRGDGAY